LQLEVLQASKDWSGVVTQLRNALEKLPTEDFQIGRILRILLDVEGHTDEFK
jgi:hypothetical protein